MKVLSSSIVLYMWRLRKVAAVPPDYSRVAYAFAPLLPIGPLGHAPEFEAFMGVSCRSTDDYAHEDMDSTGHLGVDESGLSYRPTNPANQRRFSKTTAAREDAPVRRENIYFSSALISLRSYPLGKLGSGAPIMKIERPCAR